jgi:hypothetical protein
MEALIEHDGTDVWAVVSDADRFVRTCHGFHELTQIKIRVNS